MEGNPRAGEAHAATGTSLGQMQLPISLGCWRHLPRCAVATAETAPCTRQGQHLVGNVAARTWDRQHRPGMLSCLPETCLNTNMLWKKKTFSKQAPRNSCSGHGFVCMTVPSCSTSHSTGVWISFSHCTQHSPDLLPASPLPGFPKTQKEIAVFPISHGLKINQRLSAVPGRALRSASPDKGMHARLDSCRKGAEALSKSN